MQGRRGRKVASRVGIGVVTALAFLALAAQAGAAIPQKISYQGRLTDPSGNPLPGDHSAMFAIYDDPSYGILLWSESKTVTADADGVFSTILGSVTPLDCSFEAPRWLEIYVDGLGLMPRREIVSAASALVAEEALRAGNADSLGSLPPGAYAPVDHTHYSLAASDGDPVYALYVDTDGEVGIGTGAPAGLLHVFNGSSGATPHASTDLVVESEGNNSIGFLSPNTATQSVYFGDADDIDSGWITYSQGSDKMTFGTKGVERMLMDGYGRVGIGVSAGITEELEVAGTIKVRADGYPLKLVGTSGGYIDFTTTDQQPMGLRLQNSYRTWMLINGLGGSDLLGLYDSSGPAGYERAIVVDGPTHKIGIGNSSPTARLDVSNSTGYNQFRMRTSYTPTSTTDPNGAVGDITWDDDYFYVKTSAGWKRAALGTWGP